MSNNITLTPYQQEQLEVAKTILSYKLPIEANIVSLFWKHPQLLYDYENVSLSCFNHNEWRVFFKIISDIILIENKEVVDELTVAFYLDKHPKLRDKYDEYGGYAIPTETSRFVNQENMHGYVEDLQKWNIIFKMNKDGRPVKEKLNRYADMKIEDIYDLEEAYINNLFVNATNDNVRVNDLSDGIDELLKELDKGTLVGLPYYNMPILTNTTGGCLMGDITLVGAVTGCGKSSFIRNVHIASLIQLNEPVLIMVNEESIGKFQREFIIWIANNILHKEIPKYTLRNGHFTEEHKKIFKESAEWLKQLKKDKILNFVSFNQYKTNNATKLIKKYASQGVKYFVIDTFKADSGAIDNNTRLQMIQNITALYDVIKPKSKNVHLMISCQMNSATQRYLTRDNVSEAKGILNVCSTVLLLRNVWADELCDGNNALDVYRDNHNVKELITLEPSKKNTLIFIAKNREGESGGFQIVYENDLSLNIQKELGTTNCKMDTKG